MESRALIQRALGGHFLPLMPKTGYCRCGCGRVASGGLEYRRECYLRMTAKRKHENKMKSNAAYAAQVGQALAQPITARCAACGWTERTTGAEMATAFAKHKRQCAAVAV